MVIIIITIIIISLEGYYEIARWKVVERQLDSTRAT
jgi:hypothetical protein